jgi:hypothetical protein
MDKTKNLCFYLLLVFFNHAAYGLESKSSDSTDQRIKEIEDILASTPILQDLTYLQEINKTVVQQPLIKADVSQLKIRALRLEKIYEELNKEYPQNTVQKLELLQKIDLIKKDLEKIIVEKEKELKEEAKNNKELAEKLLKQTNMLAQKATDSANSTRASFDTLVTIFFTALGLAVSIGGIVTARTHKESAKAIKEADEAVRDVSKTVKSMEVVNAELTILQHIVDFKDNHTIVVRPPRIQSQMESVLVDGKDIINQLKKLEEYKTKIKYNRGNLQKELFGSNHRTSSTDFHSNLSYLYSSVGILLFFLNDAKSALKYLMLSHRHDRRNNADRAHNVVAIAAKLFNDSGKTELRYYGIALKYFNYMAGDVVRIEKLKRDEHMPDDVWSMLNEDFHKHHQK